MVVAIQTIHLADEPHRFRHKMGEKVVVQGSDGYADPDYAGVIVDGTLQGVDLYGGAYKETYRIKRDRGGYFDAEELTLLKRFDTDDELRQEIREKIRTYALPRSMPEAPAGDLEGRETMRSPLGGSTCSACGHGIRPGGQVAIQYEHADRSVYRFDKRCSGIWIQELRNRRLTPPSR